MIVYTFQPRFCEAVVSGSKIHTVRAMRKRMPKVGDDLSLRKWSGKPYGSPQLVLREEVITRMERVSIGIFNSDDLNIIVGSKYLSNIEVNEFAINDGFKSKEDMADWFIANNKGLKKEPFHGFVTYWT